MALKGNLRDFTVTQLLNLINLAQKSGTLIVRNGGVTTFAAFDQGRLSWAENSSQKRGLSHILYMGKAITAPQFNTLKTRAGKMNDNELGLLLVNSGYVTQPDILNSLQIYYAQILLQLFDLDDGTFIFDSISNIPDDKIPVRVKMENIIIEGSRRAKELAQLNEEIPNLDISLKFTDRPGIDIKNIHLSEEEWRVVSYINPKNTLSQIAEATKISDTTLRRIVYSLLHAGLVELVRPEGQPVLPTLDKAIPGTKEEQKNLVDRLIQRIRSL
jgi:uncharacterized protein YerC